MLRATVHLCRLVALIALMGGIFGMLCTAGAPTAGYKIVAKYPHSIQSYTEGFFYRDGLFYEGTGMNGRSAVLVIQPESGKQLQRVALPPEYFGEGIIDWGPNIYQWTWQSHVCFV